MFAFYFGAFGIEKQLFYRLRRKAATTDFTVMLFGCSLRAAETDVFNWFLPCLFCALRDKGCLCTGGKLLIPLPRKIKAIVLERKLLWLSSACIG